MFCSVWTAGRVRYSVRWPPSRSKEVSDVAQCAVVDVPSVHRLAVCPETADRLAGCVCVPFCPFSPVVCWWDLIFVGRIWILLSVLPLGCLLLTGSAVRGVMLLTQ